MGRIFAVVFAAEKTKADRYEVTYEVTDGGSHEEFGADLETDRSQINVWLAGGNDMAYIYVYYCSLDIIPQIRDHSGSL